MISLSTICESGPSMADKVDLTGAIAEAIDLATLCGTALGLGYVGEDGYVALS